MILKICISEKHITALHFQAQQEVVKPHINFPAHRPKKRDVSSCSGKVSLPSLPWLVIIHSIINLSNTGANLFLSSFVHPVHHLELRSLPSPSGSPGGGGREERTQPIDEWEMMDTR